MRGRSLDFARLVPFRCLPTCAAYVVLASFTVPPASAYQQEIKALCNRLAQSIAAAGKKRVAVVDFTDLQGRVTELGRFLAEELSVGLAETGQTFEVIDRTHLKAILQEHKLSETGLIDPQTARRLGQIAGVEALVTGTITPFGDSVRVSVKVLDTQTARMHGATTTDIGRTKAIEELLGRSLGETESATSQRRPIAGGGIAGSKPQNLPELARTSADDFLFVIIRCSRAGLSVACNGAITNQLSVRRDVILRGGGYVVDNLGYQYQLRTIGFASRSNSEQLEPNSTAYFSFSVEDIPREARVISLILDLGGSRPKYWQQKVTIRNIEIPGS